MSSNEAKAAIEPHTKSKTKGIDICGNGHDVYIIRSDLHCYMKCNNHLDFSPGIEQKYEIFPLHPACSGGDHYVYGPNGISIIRGDSLVTVSDLSVPRGTPFESTELSDLCKGGDNYLYSNGRYTIIKGREYILVSHLTSTTGTRRNLYDDYVNGLYFYGAADGPMYVITQHETLGVLFTLFNEPDRAGTSYLVYPNVIDFLPGGLSISFGTTSPKWVLLKSFTNTSQKAILEWSEEITKTVGYCKRHFQSLENNWSVNTKVSMGTSFGANFLVQMTLNAQFSLSASYGGASVKSSQEDWNEEYTTTEKLSATIEPGDSVYIWQFRVGLMGSSDILFCRDLQMTNDSTPPKNNPLPIV